MGLVVVGRIAGARWHLVESFVRDAGWHGQLVFVGAGTLLATCCFPVAMLALSAGLLYGFWAGLPLVVLAALLSALISFALGRGVMRARILAFIAHRPRLRAIDHLVGQQSVKVNLLARLAPINFGLSSYVMAAARTSLRDYLIGALGALPGTVVYLWLGWATRDVSDGNHGVIGNLVLLAIGGVGLALLSLVVTRTALRAWRGAGLESEVEPESATDPEPLAAAEAEG